MKNNEEEFDLSLREIEVILLIKKGYLNKEIAQLLGVSESIIRKHRQNILNKIGQSGKAAFRAFIRNYPPPVNKNSYILYWKNSILFYKNSTLSRIDSRIFRNNFI